MRCWEHLGILLEPVFLPQLDLHSGLFDTWLAANHVFFKVAPKGAPEEALKEA